MDVRVLSASVECMRDGTLSEQIFRNPVTQNSHLADTTAKDKCNPSSLTGLANSLVINSTEVLREEDYDSGSNSSYRDITQSPVTLDSDRSEGENILFSEQGTGKEHLETIDGIKFLTFETEYDLNEFTKVEEFKGSEESVTKSDDGLFLDDTSKPDQDTRQGIVLKKTRDKKKVKGWRNKMFAGNENCSSDKKTVEYDDGFESSDIKVEPGTCSTEKCDSLINWFDDVSVRTTCYDSNKIIKEEIDEPIDIETVPYMDSMMNSKRSMVVPEPLPKPSERVTNKNMFNNSAFYSDRLDEFMKHAQLSCGLPDSDVAEPQRPKDVISPLVGVSNASNDRPKVALPRIGPKAKTLAEKRRLMNLDHKTKDSIKHHKHTRLKNISPSKHVASETKTSHLSREAVIANLDPNYKYVWVMGRPIKIVGSKGALNAKRKIPKPTLQTRTTVGPLARKKQKSSEIETPQVKSSEISKSQSEINATPTSPPKLVSKKQTSPAQSHEVSDFRAKLRPRKISIIPPTAANHSDFYDRLPITRKPIIPTNKPSHLNDTSDPIVFGIALYPEVNRPLEALPTAHLESLRHNQTAMNDDWIKFATSVVTSIKSPISPAEKIMLIVSQLQKPNETPYLIPAKIPALKYAKPPVRAPHAKKIKVLLNKSMLDSSTLCSGKDIYREIKYSYDIASLAEDMLDYIELKEELALAPIKYDPDDDRIVDKTCPIKKKPLTGRKKGSALDHELRRLNVNVIDVDEVSEASAKLTSVECVQDFCRLGCVCNSMNATNHSMMINHCRQIPCIFECMCGTQKPAEDFSTFSPTTVSKIQESTRYLARLEKEFQQTVVRGSDEMFVVKSGGGRQKREIKLPERYRNGDILLSMDFEMAETKMMSVNNTDPCVKPPVSCDNKTSSVAEKLSKPKTFVEFIPKHTAKNMLKFPIPTARKKKRIEDMVQYYEEKGVIKPSHVLMFRARGLEDVKILCMDHLLYKCPCDIHPRMMNKKIKPVPTTLSSSSDHTEKTSSYEESIYSASTVQEPTGDTGSVPPIFEKRLPMGLQRKSRCVALKSTNLRIRQLRRQALSVSRPSSINPTENLATSSSPVKSSTDEAQPQAATAGGSGVGPFTSNLSNVSAEISQAKASNTNETALVEMTKESSSPPNVDVALTQISQESAPLLTTALTHTIAHKMSPLKAVHPGQSLLCHETLLPVPEGILESVPDPSSLGVRKDSTKIPQETAQKPKPLPLPRWENPSQKSMVNHSKRLNEVLGRKLEEIQNQISEGDRQLDLNLRKTDALQLVKWSNLRKRYEDYTLQLWVTTHNNLSCPRLLITERKHELPNAMCENLRTWRRDRWDDLPPLAIDLITRTPRNMQNDLYGILYYDGTNWELCKQVKKREVLSLKSPSKLLTSERGLLQVEQTQYKYHLLLPKFTMRVRWYTINLDTKFDFLLLEKRLKVPYIHLYSMLEKSAQCGNPCRYSELSSLHKKYHFHQQFGFYADPHHTSIVFLGPFKYTENCDVKMMVYTDTRPGGYIELKNSKEAHAWWYATDGTDETVTLKNLPQQLIISTATQAPSEVITQEEVNTHEESTSMPIITSVVSLRNAPNSDWISPSLTQKDSVVPSTNGTTTRYRTILPNVFRSVPFYEPIQKLDVEKPREVVAYLEPLVALKRNPVTKGVLAVRLEPSLPHVGHFQANIYGCQRYQITLPDNDSRVLKDLKAANLFLNEFIQKQVEFYPPDLSLTWQPVMSTMAASSLPFNKYILERKHVITQDEVMTKEQFNLQMALNPRDVDKVVVEPSPIPRVPSPTPRVPSPTPREPSPTPREPLPTPQQPSTSRQQSRRNSILPQELHGPVYRLVKMVGTRKDFWFNVMREIDGVYQKSEILSQQKEQLTAVQRSIIAEFNELVRTIRHTDKRACDEAIANVRYILKKAPSRNSPDASKLMVENMENSAENEDLSVLSDIDCSDVGITNNNYSSDEDGNIVETSHDESDNGHDGGKDVSVADELPQQSSSKNRRFRGNRNASQSLMEEVRRRTLKIPKGLDIALCDSKVNSTRKEPDVLTIHEAPNMTVIPIRENASLEKRTSPGVSWNKLKPSTEVSSPRPVSINQASQNIELLDLTGEEVKVSSIKKNVRIETIELEDDDIPLMEASELGLIEEQNCGSSVVLDECKEDSQNNVEIRRVSTENKDQTVSLVADSASLGIGSAGNSNRTTFEPSRSTALSKQKIVPVPSGKTMSIRKLGVGDVFTLQNNKFCDLSSLKPGTEMSISNLHVQKLAPFPPYKFIEVPKPTSLVPKHTPTTVSLLAGGNRTSTLAKNMIVHQGPVKLQSVLQPSLQTVVSSTESAPRPKRRILPNLPVGNVRNRVTLLSSQPGVPNKTVSLMMKDGKVRVLQLPQLNTASMKSVKMMLKSKDFKLAPALKSVLQPVALAGTSRAPTQIGNEQSVTTQFKVVQSSEGVLFKATSRKSFIPHISRPTNPPQSSEPPAKKVCIRSINNIESSGHQSSSPVLNAIRLAPPSKTMPSTSTSIVNTDVHVSSPSTISSLQMVSTGTKPPPVMKNHHQAIKLSNGKGGYLIKNHFQLPVNKPLKVSDLRILGSTLPISTSSSSQTLYVKPSSGTSQQLINMPQKKSTTISRLFSLPAMGQPSTLSEEDEKIPIGTNVNESG